MDYEPIQDLNAIPVTEMRSFTEGFAERKRALLAQINADAEDDPRLQEPVSYAEVKALAAGHDWDAAVAAHKKAAADAAARQKAQMDQYNADRDAVAAEPRVFNDARRRQGFRDQAHLDAFYVYYDHVQAGRAAGPAGCGCGTPGPGYDGPDGWQPAENICPRGRALSEASR